ncbi:fibrinogen C domain-containing protein 1-like [Dendronephthya gigantea]|uniref:fibrinogen C domain-containing protein 1-like n=1 Tax=Dendronephthya gigantea TaxID=151771 RepID=UPI00106D6E3E|nr:fibrinogen C domain-containing protein 1-like [Dendronephthya gigantea]
MSDEDYDYYEPLKELQRTIKRDSTLNNESCDTLYKSGKVTTGTYTINPDGLGDFDVRCDMTTSPGRGWTIFQRRVDGSVDFHRNWSDYKVGFGNLTGEYWLGLDKIHRLTASGQNTLRVDLETFENETAYAVYESFTVANESHGYRLKLDNTSFTGTAGDSLEGNSGMKFTTQDVHNDFLPKNCAKEWSGAWWFRRCGASNLNGKYSKAPEDELAIGIRWRRFKDNFSFKVAEMKVGPGDV